MTAAWSAKCLALSAASWRPVAMPASASAVPRVTKRSASQSGQMAAVIAPLADIARRVRQRLLATRLRPSKVVASVSTNSIRPSASVFSFSTYHSTCGHLAAIARRVPAASTRVAAGLRAERGSLSRRTVNPSVTVRSFAAFSPAGRVVGQFSTGARKVVDPERRSATTGVL